MSQGRVTSLQDAIRNVIRSDIHYKTYSDKAASYGSVLVLVSVIIVVVSWAYLPERLGLSPVNYPSPKKIWIALHRLFYPTEGDYIAYYGFGRGRTIVTYITTTLTTVSLSLLIGSILGVTIGIAGGVSPYPRWTIIFWLIVYYGGIPRLLEILYINNLGIIGVPAGVILGSLAVMFCTGLATIAALQDPQLQEDVSQARLDAPNSIIIALAIVMPQKTLHLSIAFMMGAVGAVSAVIFTEYVQSSPGLGYLLQIAFGSDPHIPEAFAISICITSILLLLCCIIALWASISTPFWMFLSRVAIQLSRPRHI